MNAEPLQDKDILCLGYLKRVFDLLDKLHDVGTERDTAGNRKLHFDGYCKLVLLYIWNPLLDSISSLQEAVGLPKVAKALGVGRFSAGSFSEAPSVFDPELLKPIIMELAGQLPDLSLVPKALGDLPHLLTLVDGTVRGQEKSDVERTVFALERRFATPVPAVADVDALNRHLLSCCLKERDRTVRGRSQSIAGMFEEERRHALELPDHPFDACIQHIRQADKYQTVLFEDVRYSVPRQAAFEPVTVKAYLDQVVLVEAAKVTSTF